MNAAASLVVALALLGSTFGLFRTLKTRRTISRFGRLNFAANRQPIGFWAIAGLYVIAIVAMAYALTMLLLRWTVD